MLDVLVVMLLIAVFYKMEFNETTYNTDYISLENTKPIKGILALVVMLHHISQNTAGGVLLREFEPIGYLPVAVFFFFSGYGLLKSYKEKKGYKEQFFRRRISTILFPYLIVVLIYWLLSAIGKTPYTVEEMLYSFIDGYPKAANSWYILVLLLFYVCFYIFMAIFKKNYKGIVIATAGLCVVWSIICMIIGYGIWWYNSCICIAFGMAWALWEKTIVAFIQNTYCKLFTICLVLVWVLFRISDSLGFLPLRVLLYWGTCLVFATLICIILMKCKVGNKILDFFGEISFELYMIHGAYVRLFYGNSIHLKNELIWGILIIVTSVISAFLLHKLFGLFKNVN